MKRGVALHVKFCHLSDLIILKICNKMMKGCRMRGRVGICEKGEE